MKPSNNPTAVSAVVGEYLTLASGPSRVAALLKRLTMPILLAAFATYLLVGIITMRIPPPPGAAFPGPEFFPAIIAAGLYLFAVILAVKALRTPRGAQARGAADGEEVTQRTVRLDWRSLAWVVGSFFVFALTLNILGWIIAAALLFWCVARGFGAPRPVFTLIVGFTVSALAYIAFDMALGMSLPSGILGWGF